MAIGMAMGRLHMQMAVSKRADGNTVPSKMALFMRGSGRMADIMAMGGTHIQIAVSKREDGNTVTSKADRALHHLKPLQKLPPTPPP